MGIQVSTQAILSGVVTYLEAKTIPNGFQQIHSSGHKDV